MCCSRLELFSYNVEWWNTLKRGYLFFSRCSEKKSTEIIISLYPPIDNGVSKNNTMSHTMLRNSFVLCCWMHLPNEKEVTSVREVQPVWIHGAALPRWVPRNSCQQSAEMVYNQNTLPLSFRVEAHYSTVPFEKHFVRLSVFIIASSMVSMCLRQSLEMLHSDAENADSAAVWQNITAEMF